MVLLSAGVDRAPIVNQFGGKRGELVEAGVSVIDEIVSMAHFIET